MRGWNGLVPIILMSSSLLFGCLESEAIKPSTLNAEPIELVTRHTSIFNRIDYKIPRGWVVIDGESDWVAPSSEKQFWEPTFDPKADPYYVVSVIFPYLTMEDFKDKRVRSLEELTNATLHSLEVAASAKRLREPKYYEIEGQEASSILTTLDGGRSFFQVFIQIAPNNVASIAGGGPSSQIEDIKTLVTAISKTVEPSQQAVNKGKKK